MGTVSDKKIKFLTLQMHLEATQEEHERWMAGVFYHRVGYFPDLRDPKTFNEKLVWLRLNWTNDEVRRIVEKAEFKGWVEERLGSVGFTPMTYGVYTDPWEIDFGSLPDSFILKSTLGSAANQVMPVADKAMLDVDFARYTASEWLQRWNSSATSFAAWFRGRSSRVIAEELLVDPLGAGEPRDYKFFCFDGRPRLLHTVTERSTNKYVDFFDLEWNRLPIKRVYDNSPIPHPPRPPNLLRMIALAQQLSRGFPFARVDFYELHHRVVVGELTFPQEAALCRSNLPSGTGALVT